MYHRGILNCSTITAAVTALLRGGRNAQAKWESGSAFRRIRGPRRHVRRLWRCPRSLYFVLKNCAVWQLVGHL